MAKNIVLIVVAVLVLAGGIWYFASKRPLPEPVEAGVPIYPGAQNINADSFSARLSPRDRAKYVKVVIMATDDPPEKVISFYKEQLQEKTQVLERTERGLPAAIIRTEINGQLKMIVITVNEESEKTEISIGNISNE